MKELRITVPLFAEHRTDYVRRIALGIGPALEPWRDRLRYRGINLLSVSNDGLLSNPDGLADQVCAHIYRVTPDDLLDYAKSGMPARAIAAFTGIPAGQVETLILRWFGRTLAELKEEANG